MLFDLNTILNIIDYDDRVLKTMMLTNKYYYKLLREYKSTQRYEKEFAKIFHDKGWTYHTLNGKMHRSDGPAITWINYEIWYFHGLIHRLNGPAINWHYEKIWYYRGNVKRIDLRQDRNDVDVFTFHDVSYPLNSNKADADGYATRWLADDYNQYFN